MLLHSLTRLSKKIYSSSKVKQLFRTLLERVVVLLHMFLVAVLLQPYKFKQENILKLKSYATLKKKNMHRVVVLFYAFLFPVGIKCSLTSFTSKYAGAQKFNVLAQCIAVEVSVNCFCKTSARGRLIHWSTAIQHSASFTLLCTPWRTRKKRD